MSKAIEVPILYIEDVVTNFHGVQKFLTPYQRYKLILAKNLDSARKILTEQPVEIILLDLGLPPDINNFDKTLDFLYEIRKKDPDITVIVYSVISNLKSYLVERILKSGTSYIVKEDIQTGEDLDKIISLAQNRIAVYSQSVVSVFNLLFDNNPAQHITEREAQVLELVHDGKTNGEIARILNISVAHTRDIVSTLLRKTNTVSRTELAVHYERNKKIV